MHDYTGKETAGRLISESIWTTNSCKLPELYIRKYNTSLKYTHRNTSEKTEVKLINQEMISDAQCTQLVKHDTTVKGNS